MTVSFNVSGNFSDPETFRDNEVRFDELCRDFVEQLQQEFGGHITSASASGTYIGAQNYIATSEGNPVTARPEGYNAPAGDDYLDETVADDADGDSGLGVDDDLPGDDRGPDAGDDHPGDVLNEKYEDELSENRSVPGVELRPNPEDTLGRQEEEE